MGSRRSDGARGRAFSQKAKQFVILAYLFSWSLALAFRAAGGRWNTTAAVIVAVVYMYGPATAALIVQRRHGECLGALGLSARPNRWFLAAWLLPALLALAGVAAALLIPGVRYTPDLSGFFERMRDLLPPDQFATLRTQMATTPVHPAVLALAQGLLAGVTINALAAFGEELGWRGLLYRELEAVPFWRHSALVGLIWGLWHAPLILQGHNYPQHPVAGVLMMTVFTVLLSPLFTYVRMRSGSVVAAAIMHGTVNGTAGLPLLLTRGGSDLTVGVTGVSGLAVFAVANLLLWWRLRSRR